HQSEFDLRKKTNEFGGLNLELKRDLTSFETGNVQGEVYIEKLKSVHCLRISLSRSKLAPDELIWQVSKLGLSKQSLLVYILDSGVYNAAAFCRVSMASRSIRFTSSSQVGISWMRPMTWPAVQT